MNMIAKLLLNSLYGRFGMKDSLPITSIIKKEEYSNSIKKYGEENIYNIIDLGNHQLLQFNDSNSDSLSKDSFKGVNVNIAIAAAVTAYARIHMSQFKNNPLFPNLYYTDTDSLYFDGPLDDSFISSTELGKLKLEGTWDDAIFLSPKVYALILDGVSKHEIHTKDNKDSLVIKIKGVTEKALMDKENNINFNLFESLLFKDKNFEINQNKWFRSWNPNNESIQIKDQIYTLVQTSNKRELLFNNLGRAIGTKPFIVPITL
jgi:hypothetical protein